jgi:hypothetical protein
MRTSERASFEAPNYAPAIDILDVKTVGLRGARDPALLELAAEQGRITISHDADTMTMHFWERIESGRSSPGLFIVPQEPSVIGRVIDSLLLVWVASDPEEWRNRVAYFAFPLGRSLRPWRLASVETRTKLWPAA